MKWIILLLCLTNISCVTVAKRYTTKDNVEVLSLRGIGKAQFGESISIEGRPIFEIPPIPVKLQ